MILELREWIYMLYKLMYVCVYVCVYVCNVM